MNVAKSHSFSISNNFTKLFCSVYVKANQLNCQKSSELVEHKTTTLENYISFTQTCYGESTSWRCYIINLTNQYSLNDLCGKIFQTLTCEEFLSSLTLPLNTQSYYLYALTPNSSVFLYTHLQIGIYTKLNIKFICVCVSIYLQ